jgi:hypothetical protein
VSGLALPSNDFRRTATGRQLRSPERRSAVIPADLKSGVQRCDVARGCLAELLLSAMTVAGAVDPERSLTDRSSTPESCRSTSSNATSTTPA